MILVRISFNVSFAQLHYIRNVWMLRYFLPDLASNVIDYLKSLNVNVLCHTREHCLLHIIFRFVTVIKFSTLWCNGNCIVSRDNISRVDDQSIYRAFVYIYISQLGMKGGKDTLHTSWQSLSSVYSIHEARRYQKERYSA